MFEQDDAICKLITAKKFIKDKTIFNGCKFVWDGCHELFSTIYLFIFNQN